MVSLNTSAGNHNLVASLIESDHRRVAGLDTFSESGYHSLAATVFMNLIMTGGQPVLITSMWLIIKSGRHSK